MKPPFLLLDTEGHAERLVAMADVLIAIGTLPADYEFDRDSLRELGFVIRESADEMLKIARQGRDGSAVA